MSDSPLTRLTRALLLAAVAVVLVGLVAVAASGHGIGGSGSAEPTPYAVDTILTILFGLFAIAAVVLMVALFWVGLDARRHRHRARPQPQMRPSLLLTAIGVALVLFALVRYADHNRRRDTPLPQAPAAGSVQRQDRSTKHKDPQFQWIPFVLVFGSAGVAAAAYYLAEKRRKQRLPPDLDVTDELVETLDEMLADLRAEPDPRRAVISAYNRMERVLAAHGIPRQRSEAPHEYLGRVLAELTHGGRGAKRLTALFERARFSTHDVDLEMKAEAIDAVEELQGELLAREAEKAKAA